jgi:hypothetical protein
MPTTALSNGQEAASASAASAAAVTAAHAQAVVTQGCINAFARDGAVVLRKLLTPVEVDTLR